MLKTSKCLSCAVLFAASAVLSVQLRAAELNLPEIPLFVGGSKTALVQLIMERDNKLFFEAYPSYEDINQDGVLDIRYKPHEIDYYGYFDSNFCYQNLSGTYFEPVSKTTDKKCSDNWSGDFLNYLSMTRMDVMLRTLYGGKRLIDIPGKTVLRRAFVPWENHTWGIAYDSLAVDGFLISDYSPLAQPADGTRHLLSTSNVNRDDVPYLRVRNDTTQQIWEWVDKERTQGDGWASSDHILDVMVCKTGFLEESCQQYPSGDYKPIGILHEYGENNSMYFSLLSGSFQNNLQGGVLRQPMSSFGENEVNLVSGAFTRNPGIVTTLDAIQIPNNYHSQTVQRDCGWIWNRPFRNGECRAWGNPVAEMMYEGLRYFSGIKAPTPDFYTYSGIDATLGLAAPAWDDPYDESQPYSECSSAYQLVISDPSPSFDGDQLPGSDFGDFTGTGLPGLHVGDLADHISLHEDALPGLKFIGQVGDNADGSPSPKQVTTLRNIRGQAPEAPHRQGSYYAPSVAYYGQQNDLHPRAAGVQNVGNFTLALGSPLPSIDVDVDGKRVSFAPFAKTVNFCSRGGDFYPTNAIVGFTVESIGENTGSFRVSYEDMEQGADNDMDAVARYTYTVDDGTITMQVDSLTASGCAVQHMGYTVSGSTSDGVYLVIRDSDTHDHQDRDYKLDVPPGQSPGTGWEDGVALPLASTIEFTASSAPAAEQLPSPLWFAAKWGGFNDINEDGIPQLAEWDANNDGNPDNYFPVSDPSRIGETMRAVFKRVSDLAGSATSVASAAGSLKRDNRIYNAEFVSGEWTGDVRSFKIDADGNIDSNFDWSASDRLKYKLAYGTDREIITYNPTSYQGVPFRWPVDPAAPEDTELSALQLLALNRNPITDLADTEGAKRLSYVRGNEEDGYRPRDTPLADIVNSSPTLVGSPSYFYPNSWGAGAPENAKPYAAFGREHRNRQRVVYVGANDGMLHAFDAGTKVGGRYNGGTGDELFAYIPSVVFPKLPDLTELNYGHKYFVDSTPNAADVFINGEWRTVLIGALGLGGQGLYALDVTDPGEITEENAEDAILWEFTDREESGLGFIYSRPVIARMHNGKWMAIVASGYNNSTRNVGYQRGDGVASLLFIDIETGALISKLVSDDDDCKGTETAPNGMAEPTAIDLDGDFIVDAVYTADLNGCVTKFDVSDSQTALWQDGEVKHKAVDDTGAVTPITSSVTVGTHPSGEGVMLYFGTGKYLEPDDHQSRQLNRVYGLWDSGSDTASLTSLSAGNLLQQTIEDEGVYEFDTDDDGETDGTAEVRTTSNNEIDWETHEGWYLDLKYLTKQGEQVLATPVLRDGKVLISTHIPLSHNCDPHQNGWLMILNSVNGGMPSNQTFDIDGDGVIDDVQISGIRNVVNPFNTPNVVSGNNTDVIISQSGIESEPKSISIGSTFFDGRMTWRELEP